ncbi:MAG: S9 family peptidase [Gemmatimonadales bacterium]|nr:S9 family peptidase [Gemmatimonadales bacterium]
MPDELTPPIAPRHPRVLEIHGERLEDLYFWLREQEDPAVREYLEAENAYAEAGLAPTRALQETLYQEMLGRIKQTDLSVPYRKDGFWYYTRTEEGRQYPIHCRKRGSLDAPEQILLDLNAMAEGHPFIAIGALAVTDDGRRLAYSTDLTGFREYTLVVKDLETGEFLAGPIARAGSAAWAADGRTLFYTLEDDAKRSYRLWRLPLGGTPALVYQEDDERFRIGVGRTRSRAHIVIQSESHTTSEIRYLPADAPETAPRLLVPRVQDRELEAEHLGEGWLLRVNDTGPNFRVVRLPEAGGEAAAWTELRPHRDDVMIEGLSAFLGHWVAWERMAGLVRIGITGYAGGGTREVAFPEPVYEAYPDANPEWETGRLRYGYESPVTPTSVYEYDLATGASTLLKRKEVLGGFEPAAYGCERTSAVASDGTVIPVSLIFRRDRPPGPAPLLLTGYGAYAISYPVNFSSNRLSLLDRGVVVGIAHVRGGGELGKRWHEGGRMGKKMNSFTDFIAVAESLIGAGRTAPDRLVIEGGSAGGLLVGAVTNRRPDLFRAVVAQVPFVDVINTMLDDTLPLTVGEYEEWGNPRLPEQYRWMCAYCPYTNLRRADYPAMLVRTSLNDSQVMYWEPAKYVARLRTLTTGANPVYFVTNMGAGHGGASGRYDRLREIALDYAFVLSVMPT